MTRWMGVLTLVLATTLGACAEGAEEAGMAMDGEGDTAAAMADDGMSLACAPQADRMALEGRSSPYDSATIRVGDGAAKVCYGRPTLRGRTMIGGEAVPYGELWRTGANEPTTIHLSVPARIAGLEVEPGAYSLYTVPRDGDEWTLIVNRATGQWGHEGSYTSEVEAQEVGRAQVAAERTDTTVEQLTFRPMEQDGGLVLEWQNSRVRIPITPAE